MKLCFHPDLLLFIIFCVSAVAGEPEFIEVIENITVAAGRNVKFACSVKNLGTYKVSTASRRTINVSHSADEHLNCPFSATEARKRMIMQLFKLYIRNVRIYSFGVRSTLIDFIYVPSQRGELRILTMLPCWIICTYFSGGIPFSLFFS